MIAKFAALFALASIAVPAQPPCVVESSRAEFTIFHVPGKPKLTLNEHSDIWSNSASQKMRKDCSKQIDYPGASHHHQSVLDRRHLYLLFQLSL